MTQFLKYAAGAVIGGSLLLASCGDDNGDDIPPVPTNDAPTLQVENPDMSQMGSSIRLTGRDNDVRVNFTLVADDADDNLQALTVLRNGTEVAIPTSNVFVEQDGNVGPLSNNPLLLTGADTTGFRKAISVRTAAAPGDSVTYTFTVNDSGIDGVSREEATVTITLVNEMVTPLGQGFTNREFYNRSDPSASRPGALDLDSGDPVPSTGNTMSELQDQGNAGGDWLRQVAPENGAELYLAPDGTDFDDIESVEDLLAIFDDSGDAVALTPPLEDGDVIIVTREDPNVGSKFYAVRFNEVVNMTGTTNDRYVVDIKQN